MIKVIEIPGKTNAPTPEGHVRNVLASSEDGTRVTVAVRAVDPGKTLHVARSERTQVVYILEGQDATLAQTSAGKTSEYTTQRRSGVYLEPGDEQVHVVPLADRAFPVGHYGGRDWLLQDGLLVAVETDPLRATDARSLDAPIGGMIAIGEDQWVMLDGRIVRVDPKEFEEGTS